MLKFESLLSLEENKLIKVDQNTWKVPIKYDGLTGMLDLSDYDDLTIIIPESIQFIDSMCITCKANSPSRLKENHRNHKIVLKHTSFKNVKFHLLCFDGITKFEVNKQELIKTLPQGLTGS